MEFTSAEGERRWAALVRAAASTIVGLDFDGTLSPIVDDPAAAHIHPEASDVLVALAEQVAAVAVITGRPARQALDLGGLEEVGRGRGRRQGALPVRPVRQRALDLHRPPGDLPAPAARPLLAAARPAAAAPPGGRGGGLRRGEGPRGRRAHPPPAGRRRRLPPAAPRDPRAGRAPRPRRRARPQRDRGPLPGHAQGAGGGRLVQEVDAGGFLFAGDDLGDLEAFEAVTALA